MSEHSISDYGIFNDGVSSINKLQSKITANREIIDDCKNILDNGSIFLGPISEEALGGSKLSIDKLNKLSSNCEIMANYLSNTAIEYNTSDKNATSKVLNSVDGKVEATELKTFNLDGKVIYYNQNGYYDDSGNLHTWGTTWGKNISESGCGPTSMAACLANMLGDSSITPSTIANMMDYNDNDGGNYVAKISSRFGLDETHEIGLNKTKMDNFLDNNGTMIVAVADGLHYIAVLGRNSDGTYIVCDPNDWNTSKKTWTYNDISSHHTMVFHIAPKGKTVEECVKGNSFQV